MDTTYLDFNATAPVRPEAREAYVHALDAWCNASSAHAPGRVAHAMLDGAREALAGFLGATAREIVFTAGGTASDNLAIGGVCAAVRAATGPGASPVAVGGPHVVATAIEHPAVLETCRALERLGIRVTVVSPGPDGLVRAGDMIDAIREDTILVSMMWVNNETGVIQPVADVACAARARGVLCHSDAVQAFGRVPIDVRGVGVDLLSLSGHKFGAPPGIGALFVRRGTSIGPVIHGGGQEWNLRSGTHNVPGAVAMAEAARVSTRVLETEAARQRKLRDRLEDELARRLDGVHVNGVGAPRVANTSNLRFDGVDGESVVLALDAVGIAVSSASACAASHHDPSHVLLAMGLSEREASGSIRISMGWTTHANDVDRLLEELPRAIARSRDRAAAVRGQRGGV